MGTDRFVLFGKNHTRINEKERGYPCSMFGNIPLHPEDQQGYVDLVISLILYQTKTRTSPRDKFKESLRHAATIVARALETLHKNPGPPRGNVGKRTQERKNQSRKTKKAKAKRAKRKPKSKQNRKIKITPWNLQHTMRQSNRSRRHRTVEFNGEKRLGYYSTKPKPHGETTRIKAEARNKLPAQ